MSDPNDLRGSRRLETPEFKRMQPLHPPRRTRNRIFIALVSAAMGAGVVAAFLSFN